MSFTTRRDFIKQTASLTAASFLPLSCWAKETTRYKIGLQLYSIRDYMDKDPLDTLNKVKAMGYEDFETYGLGVDNLHYYNMPAATFRNMLDDLELTTSSGHYDFASYFNASDDELKYFVDQCIKGAISVGHKYITWPWLAPENRNMEGYKMMVDKLNRISEQIHAAGLSFAYHNHGYEFTDHDGDSCFALILRGTDPELVKLQLDMYWVAHNTDESPADIIARDPKRFVMWHIKDMDKQTRDYTEMGNGSIDYHDILKNASQEGLEYYFIEQGGNYTVNSMQSAADSMAYFKKELLQYF